MITGDNAITAKAVANKIGLDGKVMEGIDLERITDNKLNNIVNEIVIFARVDPKHKVRILKALQSWFLICYILAKWLHYTPI